MTDPPLLRVLSCDLAGLPAVAPLGTLVRSCAPDVVVLQHGPRRLRWRTRGAALADQFGLVVGGGGEPALGNLVLVSLRVAVPESWCVQFPLAPGHRMRGAALVRGSVGGRWFVVAGCALAPQPDQRSVQAAIMGRVLSEVDVPVVLAAQVAGGPDAPAWRTLADGRSDAGAGRRTSDTTVAIFVSPGLAVRDYREVAVAGARYPAIMADLALVASDDQGQMVSGSGRH